MTFFGLDIIAGALVAFAALPKVITRLQERRSNNYAPLNYGDVQRDSLIVAGNLIWVYFGLQNAVYGLVIFGAINVVLTSLLITQAISASISSSA